MFNIDAIINWIQSIHEPYTYLLVFGILLLCGFGLPIPEDITLITGGLMAYYGKADVFVMIGVGLAGVMIGDGAMFQLGKRFGTRVFEWKWLGSSRVLRPLRCNKEFCVRVLRVEWKNYL